MTADINIADPDEPELDPNEPRPGEMFANRYKVLRLVGRGGMGKVFEVVDTRIGRAVALKLMRNRASERPSLVQRFHREYRAMAKIRHTGVPRILDAGSDASGRIYFTMELVRGKSLLTNIQDLTHATEPRWMLGLVIKVAQILSAVHAAGIVHRDIKPSNILLDTDQRPYLIDFGACRIFESTNDTAAPEPPTGAIHTAPGTWLGTLGYVDPVMLDGAGCDARSDIYSLMATLSWMFTRQHPSVDAAGPPRTAVPAIDAVLARGMARNPDERPATAESLIAELLQVDHELQGLIEPSRRPHLPSQSSGRRLSPAVLLAFGIFGGVLGGILPSAALPREGTAGLAAAAPRLCPPQPPKVSEAPPSEPSRALATDSPSHAFDPSTEASPAAQVEAPATIARPIERRSLARRAAKNNLKSTSKLVTEICWLKNPSVRGTVCLELLIGPDGVPVKSVVTSISPSNIAFGDPRGIDCISNVAKEHLRVDMDGSTAPITSCFTVTRKAD